MSSFNRIKILVFPVMWLLLHVLPAASMDADDAPESVTIEYLKKLFEEVIFDHQMHSDEYSCSACHHHTAGDGPQNNNCKKCHISSAASDDVSCSGCHQYKEPIPVTTNSLTAESAIYHIDKPGLKGALHLLCLGCHQSENGPTGCQECHAFTPAGRKRFAIKN